MQNSFAYLEIGLSRIFRAIVEKRMLAPQDVIAASHDLFYETVQTLLSGSRFETFGACFCHTSNRSACTNNCDWEASHSDHIAREIFADVEFELIMISNNANVPGRKFDIPQAGIMNSIHSILVDGCKYCCHNLFRRCLSFSRSDDWFA